MVATRKHEVADPYLDLLEKEVASVSEYCDKTRPLAQLHWGGGTPTYLNLKQIERLFGLVTQRYSFADNAEISIEVDPRVTSDEQLTLLHQLGFNRLSMGVQDFEPRVQKAIGRIQPETLTRTTIETARKNGFKSVNCDLVYGLPFQTLDSFRNTLKTLLALDPDRVALFHFAYVPWMQANQRKIDADALPDSWTKLEMFGEAITAFQNAGYAFIGLDHFAKKNDELALAQKNRTMHRNFQGYTTQAGTDLVGFGVTAISTVAQTFSQNSKKLKNHEKMVLKTGFSTEKGLKLTKDDQIRQWVIHQIFCHQWIDKKQFYIFFGLPFDDYFAHEIARLDNLSTDQIVVLEKDGIRVTPLGRFFLRNVAMVFDAHLEASPQKFSKTL